jgi:hypothetical protein
MTDVVNKHLLAFGHSHLNALRRAYRRFYGNGEDPSAPPPFAVTFVQLHQDVFQPNILDENGNRRLNDTIKERFNTLIKRGRPDVIVSCAMGNEYNNLGMLNHPQRFDFYLPARLDLPTDETAEVLPVDVVEDLIRLRLDRSLDLYFKMISSYGGVPKIHVPPPPPIRETAYIEAYPGVFGEKAKKFGVSPAFFRLKMWLLTCEVQQKLCAGAGITLHSLPTSVFDPDGFLAKPFLNQDPTHGNAKYGKVILDDLARTSFPGLVMEETRERAPVQESAGPLLLAARP